MDKSKNISHKKAPSTWPDSGRPVPYKAMYQNHLIATIFLLFLAQAVSGLPFHKGHHRHGGHHRFRHRHPAPSISFGNGKRLRSPHAQEGTPATPIAPKIPIPLPTPAIPGIPGPAPAQPPPSLPDGIIGEISEHAKMFGWDPKKAIKGCGANCDPLKYLQQQEFLVAHNWVRLLFKLPLFTWDYKLESAAKQTAMQHYDDCKMVHSDFPYGENLFWSLQSHWTPSDAVYSWYNESIWYNLKSLQCSAPPGDDCAHFTQVVWKDSVRLGCSLQHCRDPSKGMLIVCEYDPPGNYDNENPLDDNNAKRAHQT